MMTYISHNFNYAEFRVKFCQNSNIEINNKSLFKTCRNPCYEELYEIWYSNEKGPVNHLILKKLNPFYIVLEHNPETIFIQFLANFGGLIGLWHGLSIFDLENLITKFINKIFNEICARRKVRKFSEGRERTKIIKAFSRIQVNRVLGMPTLHEVKAGEKFLKGLPKDNFRKLFIFSLKSKGEVKGKFLILQL
jgi:hypothetical protein